MLSFRRIMGLSVVLVLAAGAAIVVARANESAKTAAASPFQKTDGLAVADPSPSPTPEPPRLTEAPTEAPTEAATASPTPIATPAAETAFRPGPGKTIELDLAKQQLIAWDNGVAVYRFTVSSGRRGFRTPKGVFKIHTKYELRWSRKWKVWMPYAMFWHTKHGYAFHELPYRSNPAKRVGASRLGRPDSHGCVRVNVGDAKVLYEWAPVGTPVWIH